MIGEWEGGGANWPMASVGGGVEVWGEEEAWDWTARGLQMFW